MLKLDVQYYLDGKKINIPNKKRNAYSIIFLLFRVRSTIQLFHLHNSIAQSTHSLSPKIRLIWSKTEVSYPSYNKTGVKVNMFQYEVWPLYTVDNFILVIFQTAKLEIKE